MLVSEVKFSDLVHYYLIISTNYVMAGIIILFINEQSNRELE